MMIKPNQYYFTYWHGDKGELYRPVFKVQPSLTDLQYKNPLTFGYKGTWAAFPKSNGNKIIPSESAPNNWINYYNQGKDYPYWYEQRTR